MNEAYGETGGSFKACEKTLFLLIRKTFIGIDLYREFLSSS